MAQSLVNSGELPRLNFPLQKISLKREKGVVKIYDSSRHKYIVLTPEEYVRQQFVVYLQNYLHYPSSLIANEIGIELNGMKKRCDTVVFDSDGSIIMIIEYKAPEIQISQIVFDQVVRYNLILRARYLVVTNGLSTYCCRMDYKEHSYSFLKNVPEYTEIAGKNN